MPLQRLKKKSNWEKTDEIIDKWLEERQELLVLYNLALEALPYSEGDTSPPEALTEFCDILIDYVSAGHFEIFEKMAEATKQCAPEYEGLDRKLFISLLETTNIALDFSSQFGSSANHNASSQDISKGLSKLGEAIANRLEVEDKLIESYITATSLIETQASRA